MDKNTFLLNRAKMLAEKNKHCNVSKDTEPTIASASPVTYTTNNVDTNIVNNTNQDKYNPDVIKKFTEINHVKNRNLKVEFVPEYYKTITNQPIKEKITNVKDLQLEKDKPEPKKLSQDYNINLNNRIMEKEIVQKSITEFKKKNNIKVKTVEELDREYQENLRMKQKEKKNNEIVNNINNMQIEYISEGQSHNNLRKEFNEYSLEESDKIAKQKQRYNNILQSLSKII